MILYSWIASIAPLQKEEIFDLFLAAFLPQGRSTKEHLTAYFNQKIAPRFEKGQPTYVAMDKEKIIGFALFQHWDESSYYLAEMALLPEYQGHGVGKKLVFSIFEKNPASKRILLITEKDNHSAQSFYKKIGFQHSSFIHPDYPENFTSYEYHLS